MTDTRPSQNGESTVSALQSLIQSSTSKAGAGAATFSPHLDHLALQVAHNLRFQHGWTKIRLDYQQSAQAWPRPVISGLPPQRLYVHPDEQIELLQKQKDAGKSGMPELGREREWVLPSHLRETWSLRRFAGVFDALPTVAPEGEDGLLFEESGGLEGTQSSDPSNRDRTTGLAEATDGHREGDQTNPWRVSQPKRLLLATVDDDSTVVYYIVHDGIVKPRQN